MSRKNAYLYPWLGALGLAVLTAGMGYFISNTSKDALPVAKPSASMLTAAAVFAVPPTQAKLQTTLATLAQESTQPRKNPATEKAVGALTAELNDNDYRLLHEKILTPTTPMSEREAAVYVLTLSVAPQAAKTLILLAESPLPDFKNLRDPHSADSLQRTQELGLRVTALESLDQRASQSPEIAQGLRQILQKQKEPSLRFLAQTSLSGLESGKPGRLKRIIDEMLGSGK